MRIEWTPPLRPAGQRRDDKGTVADRSFSPSLGETASTSKPSATSALASISGLLSLQEVEDWQGGRRRGVARGEKLLDALDEIRNALLAGLLPLSRMRALAQLASEAMPLVDDPKLVEILGEIELRAAVELAKLEGVC